MQPQDRARGHEFMFRDHLLISKLYTIDIRDVFKHCASGSPPYLHDCLGIRLILALCHFVPAARRERQSTKHKRPCNIELLLYIDSDTSFPMQQFRGIFFCGTDYVTTHASYSPGCRKPIMTLSTKSQRWSPRRGQLQICRGIARSCDRRSWASNNDAAVVRTDVSGTAGFREHAG